MTLTFHWFLPTYGDSRDIVGGGHGVAVGTAGGARPADRRLPRPDRPQRRAARLRRRAHPDRRLVRGRLADHRDAQRGDRAAEVPRRLPPRAHLTRRWPRRWPPRSSGSRGGRLLLNVVTGGESQEQRAYGDFLDKDARYARADEFLDVVRGLWRGETVDHDGAHVRVEGARLAQPAARPGAAIYFGGSSAAAGPVAVRHSDVYLTWGEPPAQVAKKIDWIRGLAAEAGRELRFGIRLHVISRDTAEQAWAQAHRLIERHRRGPDPLGAGRAAPQRVRGAAADAGAARRLPRRAGGLPEPLGRRRPGPRRGRHRAGGQPHRGRRPDRRVPRPRHRRVHPLRTPAPGGGVLVRRGRAADPARRGLWKHPAGDQASGRPIVPFAADLPPRP